jgi:hypothetical protein
MSVQKLNGRNTMKRTAIVLGVALIATGAIGVVGTQPVNAQEGVTRTPILKKDLEATLITEKGRPLAIPVH